MHSTLQKWLNELEEETLIVQSSEINEEARGNMVLFGVPKNCLNEWGQDSLIEFIVGCRDLYRTKCGNTSMQFYSWYDQQSGHLRISAVSTTHNRLPFGCAVVKCELHEIVKGLFADNSRLFSEKGELNVWQSGI